MGELEFNSLSASVLLDWHQSRRGQSLPTITLLVGKESLGLRRWRQWDTQQKHATIVSSELASATRAWFHHIKTQFDLIQLASEWLRGSLLPQPSDTPTPSCMTKFDLDQLWKTLPDARTSPVGTIVYELFSTSILGQPFNGLDVFRRLGVAAFYTAFCRLVPESSWPSLVIAFRGNADEFQQLLKELECLANAVSLLPVAVCVPEAVYECVQHQSTRNIAMAREGVIRLTGISASDLSEHCHSARVPEPHPIQTIQFLANYGIDHDLAEAFAQSAVECASETLETEDVHRSASEKFLFELLESMPQTAGVFRPNHEMDFLHGHRRAEADLAAPELKLIIEIDGAYYHLNPEQYRRDRRKDHSYQSHGYWVLRFLAEDVVAELEIILNTILQAVTVRRRAMMIEESLD